MSVEGAPSVAVFSNPTQLPLRTIVARGCGPDKRLGLPEASIATAAPEHQRVPAGESSASAGGSRTSVHSWAGVYGD